VLPGDWVRQGRVAADVFVVEREPPMDTTIVIFRMGREGIVFALFPELPADTNGVYCTCFQHIGQHCAADYHGCIAESRPATLAEHADLLAELKQRGYDLEIRQRAAPIMHERRRQLAADVLEVEATK
jgi:hypothetical protein